jgi:hypothetical protein
MRWDSVAACFFMNSAVEGTRTIQNTLLLASSWFVVAFNVEGVGLLLLQLHGKRLNGWFESGCLNASFLLLVCRDGLLESF